MKIVCTQLNPKACKTYLVAAEGGSGAILIDPVLEHVRDYLGLLRERGLALSHVVDTHVHADHISGSAALKDITGCEYLMHASSPVICAQFRVNDGFAWRVFGDATARVVHTPGHTRDSICLLFPEFIFTGDTLFLDDGGAGRDDLAGGDAGAHWQSLVKLKELPDHLVVYPAHDYMGRSPSSLGRQKKTNPCLRERSAEGYTRVMEGLRRGTDGWMDDVLRANYACARDLGAAWVPADAPACSVPAGQGPSVNEIMVSAIPPQVLREKLKSPRPPVLVDVREREELQGELGHIDGVVHVPVGSLVHRIGELEPYREREIVAVCRSGARAHTAAQILAKSGFAKVSVLVGGMLAWNTAV